MSKVRTLFKKLRKFLCTNITTETHSRYSVELADLLRIIVLADPWDTVQHTNRAATLLNLFTFTQYLVYFPKEYVSEYKRLKMTPAQYAHSLGREYISGNSSVQEKTEHIMFYAILGVLIEKDVKFEDLSEEERNIIIKKASLLTADLVARYLNE